MLSQKKQSIMLLTIILLLNLPLASLAANKQLQKIESDTSFTLQDLFDIFGRPKKQRGGRCTVEKPATINKLEGISKNKVQKQYEVYTIQLMYLEFDSPSDSKVTIKKFSNQVCDD